MIREFIQFTGIVSVRVPLIFRPFTCSLDPLKQMTWDGLK